MIKKEDYEYIGMYKCHLLYYALVHRWVNHKKTDDCGIQSNKNGKSLVLDGHLFVNRQNWKNMRTKTSEAVKSQDDSFFVGFFSFGEKEISKMLSIAERFDSSERTDAKQFNDFFSALQDMQFPWMLTIPMGDAMESCIKLLFKKYSMPEEKIKHFFTPAKPTLLIKQREELKKIRSELERSGLYNKITNLSSSDAISMIQSSNEKLYHNIKEHVKEFKWFGMMHLWGEPFGEEEFIKQVTAIKEKPLNKAEQIILPPKLEWLKKQAQKITYLRNTFAEACAIASYKSLPMIEKAAERIGITLHDARYLSPEEFLDGLKGKPMPEMSVINERKKAFGLILLGGKSTIIIGKELEEHMHNILPKKNTENLKGTIACTGIAKGRVKLVFTPADIAKVEKGDIIVAPETTPDFLPAFHKASGIITDMGGITGHAAIVSREFSLPCIVGTKNATRFLHDNDIVELDANKGVIRKLK